MDLMLQVVDGYPTALKISIMECARNVKQNTSAVSPVMGPVSAAHPAHMKAVLTLFFFHCDCHLHVLNTFDSVF